ncbi:hypothetical protein M3Y98_01001800 [Aphelenchoides besseyi]|nr:hypothetical protein M3Y98_01001800 [Aphelenchoides besseyi]
MSLFHIHQWYETHVEEGRYITSACLIGHRDQILIGSLTGILVIVDPGKDIENRHEVSILVEKQLPHPILQILVGRFLASYDENLLAVLHPKHLAFYRLNSVDEESYTVERIFEHRLKAGPAFIMCLGEFSRQQFLQIYIQSMNCTLSIYEGENHLLDRQMITAIHPVQAVVFCVVFRITVSRQLVPVLNSKKKINWEWSFNLGDTAVDIYDVNIAPIQPSILVLCKRALYCMTHGGSPRFIIRLQAIATSLLVYKTSNDPTTQICIGTATKTLLFYRDVKMVWSAQMEIVPIYLLLSTFGDNYKSMITALSDDCKLMVGYLGTEPSLFRMPITETRYIDFEKRRAEMQEFENTIRTYSKDSNATVGTAAGLDVKTSVEMDKKSQAYDTYDGVPSATLTVKINSAAKTVQFSFKSEVFAHNEYFTLTPAEYGNVLITVFVRQPVRDSRFSLAATTNSGDSFFIDENLPLKLICHETNSQRNAQIKLSVDSTGNGLEIGDLYPEFESENQTSIGFQPYGSDVVISLVIVCNLNLRSFFTLFSTIFSDVCGKKQPDAKFSCPVPLHLFVVAINDVVELEKRKGVELKDVERVSVQMRHVETVLLNKLKAEREETMTPINVLINYTYRELLTLMDRQKATEDQLERHRNQTLKPLLNLMSLVMELSGIHIPFDGRILDGSHQSLAERLPPLLGASGAGAAEFDGAELTRLLVSFCEQGGRMGGIIEMPEEEEEETEVEQHDLVHLETGALPMDSSVLESYANG